MEDSALKVVTERNQFYRNNYRRMVGAVLIMVVVNIVLAVTLVYEVLHRPPPAYFATTADGRTIPLYPLNEPIISQTTLLKWSEQAAIASYTYGFVNYRKQLQEAANYFTPEGWTSFQNALISTRNLKTVQEEHLSVSAVVTGQPVIMQQGVIGGRYAWRVQLPILVTYSGASGQTIQQTLTVSLLIGRVPTLNTPRGIAISSFIATGGQNLQDAIQSGGGGAS